LNFPTYSHVHILFHVSFINNLIGDKILVQTISQEINEEGKIIMELETIHETRIKQLQIDQSLSSYQVEEPINRKGNMGGWFIHGKTSTGNQRLREILIWMGGALKA